MKIVSCQPDEKYFHWQLELQFLNLQDLQFRLEDYIVLLGYQEKVSEELLLLMEKYPKVSWKVYKDERERKKYIPSIRPYLLYKLFVEEEITDPIFFIDSDVIFRELPGFDRFTDKQTWYLSSTESYMNSTYIESKGEGLLEDMCRVIGIDPDRVKESKSGGAQWYIQNTDYHFWRKCYNDCESLYKFLEQSIPFYSKKWSEKENKPITQYHPLQYWCTDMWVLLWNGILKGNKIETPRELEFCWATCMNHRWVETKIFHNAGVLEHQAKDFFYKGDHIGGINKEKLYFDTYSDRFCSKYYINYIERLVHSETNT